MMDKIRDLRADEIECRVSQVKPNGIALLLYKDARCDMNILDETFGCENWQNKFYESKGILFCSLGINVNYQSADKPAEWVWKDDAGSESNMEAQKGNASDARKRAGFAWGIGRELYTAPFIWIEKGNYKEKDGKVADRFTVTDLMVVDKKIGKLAIKSEGLNKVVYSYERAGAFQQKCRLYLDTLKDITGRDDEDLYNEAVKMAKSTNYEQICYALVKMLRSVKNE